MVKGSELNDGNDGMFVKGIHNEINPRGKKFLRGNLILGRLEFFGQGGKVRLSLTVSLRDTPEYPKDCIL